jgi:ADP-ribose pyrophosphatase
MQPPQDGRLNDGVLDIRMAKKITAGMARNSSARRQSTKRGPGKKAAASPGTLKSGKSPVQVLSSKLSYDGPLFQIYTDHIRENGVESRRDVVRHGGSVVILAVDDARDQNNPMVIVERQYRHAAGEYLLEIPAGKLEPGESLLSGAKRELLEETGFRARRWRKLARYFASPGFLGEWMQVFVAHGLTRGPTRPDADEQIEIQEISLADLLRRIEEGKIHDGKTMNAVLLYERLRRRV